MLVADVDRLVARYGPMTYHFGAAVQPARELASLVGHDSYDVVLTAPLADPLPRLTFAGFTRVRSDLDSEVPKFATIPFTVSAGQSAERS